MTAPGVAALNVTKGFASVSRDGAHEVRFEQIPIDKLITLRSFASDDVFGEADVTVALQGEARVDLVLAIAGHAVFDIDGVPPARPGSCP